MNIIATTPSNCNLGAVRSVGRRQRVESVRIDVFSETAHVRICSIRTRAITQILNFKNDDCLILSCTFI